ncbi:hypothetical protein [Ferruginibacter profundus]
MEKKLIEKLNSDYTLARKVLKTVLAKGKMKPVEINTLLTLKNNLIISEFLESYKHFTKEDLVSIELFIVNNLDHKDRLFVSDLIEFAYEWNLSLPYEKCIAFLKKFNGDNTYVQLASIDYVFLNLKFQFIDEIYIALNAILQNPQCNQSNQVLAAFYLFRITYKKEFLIDLLDLVVNGDSDNKKLLKNILKINYNSSKYFEYYDTLKSIG